MSTRIAEKVALKSTQNHRLGAVIVKGGRVISTGFNQMRPSSVLRTPTLHAEAAAILKVLNARRQHDLIGSSLYVSRWTNGGRIGLARPCAQCMGLIRAVGIRTVHYSNDVGESTRIKINV